MAQGVAGPGAVRPLVGAAVDDVAVDVLRAEDEVAGHDERVIALGRGRRGVAHDRVADAVAGGEGGVAPDEEGAFAVAAGDGEVAEDDRVEALAEVHEFAERDDVGDGRRHVRRGRGRRRILRRRLDVGPGDADVVAGVDLDLHRPAVFRLEDASARGDDLAQGIVGAFGFADFVDAGLEVRDRHGLPARQDMRHAIDGEDEGRLRFVRDARVVPDPPAVEGDPVKALADLDFRIGHGLLEIPLVFLQAFRTVGIADVGDFLVRHGRLRAVDDGGKRSAGRAGLDLVHPVGDAAKVGPDDPVLAVAALVVAVAFVAGLPRRVRDPVPLPGVAAEVADVAGGLARNVHVVATNAPEPPVDGLRKCDFARLGIRLGFGFRFGFGSGVGAVVEVRPLARHGDLEAVIHIGEGDGAVHAVDVVAARAGDEDGVAVLEARVLSADVALDGGELRPRQLIAGPDHEIRGTLLDDGEVDRLGNRVSRRLVVVLREAPDAKGVGRESGRDSQERRRHSGDEGKGCLLIHNAHRKPSKTPKRNI